MNYADAIYRRSLSLPDPAAREALDFIDFLLQRYGTTPSAAGYSATHRDSAALIQAVAGGWGPDVPDDIDDADLAQDALRDEI
ncbi:DUF2281 domain-containing protein [Sphaerotilus microaerophilus]|jgi:hypothetical protein|uniref:DUF2281 domain-containing protein n=1 Tax=Sphaerotilus microaerophilus TaxID=2914710 RepID=A0ABN6PNX7_9BURK|nr:DUF2281 domain-containing protein [Sphaerotilus sp. FB-5]BDI06921.1 hypothetical protein CATMQ487_38910 [Sphaerotilus sp. FB-5]